MTAPAICLHSTALILQMKGLGGLSTTSLSSELMSHMVYLIGELPSAKGELVGKSIVFIEITLIILPLKESLALLTY